MKKIKALALALCLGIIMVGCNNTQKGATIGTAGGAVLGAIIGKIAGNAGVGAAIGGAVGAGTGAIIGNRMDKVKKQAEAVQNAQVQQVTDANGLQAVKVTFDSGILFPTSSSTLQASAQSSLIQFANVLKQNTDADVAIQGYTDNDPWKGSTAEQSVQKNLNLSQQRAQSVSTFLIGQGVVLGPEGPAHRSSRCRDSESRIPWLTTLRLPVRPRTAALRFISMQARQ